jgi:hypothetical protein
MVGLDGVVRTACSIHLDDKILPIGGGVLSYGEHGLQVVPNLIPQRPENLPCVALEEGAKDEKDLAKLYKKVRGQLAWQTVGTGAYALGRQGGALIIFARLGPDGTNVSLRLSDGDHTIDAVGQMATFTPTHPQFTGGGSWIVDAAQRISADGEPIVLGLRLLASPERLPGTALFTRATCGEACDTPAAPWWLRRVWRPVTGGP